MVNRASHRAYCQYLSWDDLVSVVIVLIPADRASGSCVLRGGSVCQLKSDIGCPIVPFGASERSKSRTGARFPNCAARLRQEAFLHVIEAGANGRPLGWN